MSTTQLKQKIELITQMGIALHKYGTSAERLEASLTAITQHLGIRGEFFSTPTYLAIAFNYIGVDGEEEQINKHIRINPGETHLAKLQQVDHIANQIFQDEVNIKEAILAIKHLDANTKNYHSLIVILAFGFISAALSVILKGGMVEAILALFLGGYLGVLSVLKSKFKKVSEIFEFIVSFLIVFACYVIASFNLSFNFQTVILASVIVIVPGLDITVAMSELATKNLASGTARLMGALVDLGKISFGILLGVEVAKLFYPELHLSQTSILPSWAIYPAILVASSAFTVVFNATKRDFVWILLSGVITFGSIKSCSLYFNPTVSLFISAFVIGMISNLFARIKNRPALIPLLPGIIYLVPGSIGLKGINNIFQNNLMDGLAGGMQMFMIAITIVAALFMANVFIHPRRFL